MNKIFCLWIVCFWSLFWFPTGNSWNLHTENSIKDQKACPYFLQVANPKNNHKWKPGLVCRLSLQVHYYSRKKENVKGGSFQYLNMWHRGMIVYFHQLSKGIKMERNRGKALFLFSVDIFTSNPWTQYISPFI